MTQEETIEVTGEDVEQALARGLETLGVGPEDVIVEVLEEPAGGLFGAGARPARVRLRLLAGGSSAAADEAALDDSVLATLERDVRMAAEYPVEQETDSPFAEGDGDSADFLDGDVEEDAEVGRIVLAELLENMAVRAEVQVRRGDAMDEEEPPWMLDIVGESDLSVLIGRKGETLASLQYITRLVTSRELQRRANIVVDVGGYKARRMNRLFALARRMADQATSLGRPVALEPMPPYERRIVHLALRERDDVTTESSGEGQARKVNIIPAEG